MSNSVAKPNKAIKIVQVILLALITVGVCVSSINSMRANAWFFNAKNTLQGLNSQADNTVIIELAQSAISLASELDPAHPHYHEVFAHVKLLQLNPANTDEAIAHNLRVLKQAEARLLESVKYRQTWAETWIALAKVVSYQEGPTDRVFEYIEQAKRVGPYKIDVHLGAIEIALMNWQQLPPKYKALYVNELKLAAKHGHKFSRAFDIAKQVEALPILCLSLKFGAHFESLRTSWMFKKQCK
jgi:hypothetical protein